MHTLMIIFDPSAQATWPMVGDWLRRHLKADDCYILGNVWACRTSKSAKEVRNLILETNLVGSSSKFLVVPVDGNWEAHNCHTPDQCFG